MKRKSSTFCQDQGLQSQKNHVTFTSPMTKFVDLGRMNISAAFTQSKATWFV